MKKLKLFTIIFVIAASVLYAMPTAGILLPEWMSGYLPTKKVNLGLDLQGGTHLVLEVDTSKLPQGANADEAVEMAKEIIRNRIDQFGVAEPIIQRQGTNQIIVELPGIKDPGRAKELIGKTAQLEFRLVDDVNDAQTAITENKIPEDDELVTLENKNAEGKISIIQLLIKKQAELTGRFLTDAQISFDEYNNPIVSIAFNPEGAELFSNITGNNIGRRLAIVLDGVAKSAPVIRERIPSGKAEISGSFSMEEAKDLSIILRAGSLPAPVSIGQEQTIGPSLGSDSIKSGILCGIISLMLTWICLILYYKGSGFIANFALLINLIMLVAIMPLINATLTFPGIAGMILAIGMSVDANILVFERIREELKLGKTAHSALENGYKKAFVTIFDSNFTTVISAVFLYWFGTGSVRGFAVTLIIGLCASMFTAITLSRFIQEAIIKQNNSLSI